MDSGPLNLLVQKQMPEDLQMAAAGYFGEGAKVELNRLVAQKASVEYRTGNVLWNFEYLTADGCENPDLHIVSRRLGPTADGHTTMKISFPAKWNAKGKQIHAALDFQNYLFFQDSYPALSWPIPNKAKPEDIAGLEILPDAKHHGRIFAHGMPVCLESSLKGFGLNYLGELTISAFQTCHLLENFEIDLEDAAAMITGGAHALLSLRCASHDESQSGHHPACCYLPKCPFPAQHSRLGVRMQHKVVT